MKHIGMYVWNNFLNDDRVRKKADTLSKKYKVTVHSVCKKPQPKRHINYSKNIDVYFYWFNTSFLQWLWNRTLGNRFFWHSKLGNYDIIDCNDPDTLWAGVYCKQINPDAKLVYDSHEYWKGTMRKEYTLKYTLYSYVVNTWQYLREYFLVKYVNHIICVSGKVKEILVNAYHKPCTVIMNMSTYNKNCCKDKQNRLCYFGGHTRPGVAQIGTYFKSKGIEPVTIGGKLHHKDWTDLGYMDKPHFQQAMAKSKYGLHVFDVTCNNIKYTTSNKFFEYIQAELPIIVNEDMQYTRDLVKKYDVGVVIKNTSRQEVMRAINKLQSNYSKYLSNIRKVKTKLCWGNQEPKLMSIYNKL